MTDAAQSPLLSVVIAATGGLPLLERCLAALTPPPEPATEPVETLVVRNYDGGAGDLVRRRFPWALDVPMDPSTTVPRLRAEGLRRSRGRVVAFLEDHSPPTAGWRQAILAAHRPPQPAAGGPVDQAPGASALDWAVYFSDYNRFIPPLSGGPAPALAGNNMTFDREVLATVAPDWREGVFEATIFPALRRAGYVPVLVPQALVVHRKRYRLGPALSQSWHLARGYAAQRVAVRGAARWVYALGSVALPVLLPARVIVRVIRRRRVGALLRALPLLVALLWTWSAGEAAGYLLGPGRSLGRWR